MASGGALSRGTPRRILGVYLPSEPLRNPARPPSPNPDGYKDIYANNSLNCTSTTSALNQNFVRPTLYIGISSNDQQMEEFLSADWHLKTGSTYIDAGSLDNLPDWVINGTDLAGNPRTHNGKISLGAYEYDPSYTGIKELQHPSNISVSQNSAIDFITISGLQSGETLYVYNISGHLLFSRKATSEKEQVAVGHLPAGIYLVKTSNGQILKWIKK